MQLNRAVLSAFYIVFPYEVTVSVRTLESYVSNGPLREFCPFYLLFISTYEMSKLKSIICLAHVSCSINVGLMKK